MLNVKIGKYVYWQFIAAILPVFLLCIMLPHKLFPQTAQAHAGKFLLLSVTAIIIVLYFIFDKATKPRAILTLQIDKGEFTLTQGDKTIISELESNIQLVLGQYKLSTTNHNHELLLRFMNQHNKQLMRVKVSALLKFNKGFPASDAHYHTSDAFGYYEIEKPEAEKILKHFGKEHLVSFY